MDTVLAILVLGAVIFFGALISAGNERQRKALDGIREQAMQWTMQDLRLKRAHIAKDVKVDDPVAWLNRAVAKVVGEDLGLVISQVFDKPQAILCTAKSGRTVVISLASPNDIQQVKKEKRSKLSSRIGQSHPLINLARNTKKVEISILNGGVLFDLELCSAWKQITNLEIIDGKDILWVYL